MDTELLTYQDAVEHLLDFYNEERDGRPLRMARRACREAVRDLSRQAHWMYYHQRRNLTTVAQQTTGTVVYDHTGGAYERMLTLTDATWPTDARFYRVIIAGKHYDIDDRKTPTIITLSVNNSPVDDIASTTYTLYRSTYPLPVDFARLNTMYDTDQQRQMDTLLPDVVHSRSISYYDTPATPWGIAIRGTQEYYNSMSVEFSPAPDSAVMYDYMYQRASRPLVTEKYTGTSGTATMAGGTTSVTVSNATLKPAHVGAVIRFGDASNEPTSYAGGIDGTDSPYVAQRIILAVNSTTSCTVDASYTDTLTDVLFVISDPVDVELGSMATAFLRLAEARFAFLTKRDMDVRRDRERASMEAIALAKEYDLRWNGPTGPYVYDYFSRVVPTTED